MARTLLPPSMTYFTLSFLEEKGSGALIEVAYGLDAPVFPLERQ